MPLKHGNTTYHKKVFESIPAELEVTGKRIVDSAYALHKALGPGLLVYGICFCHELSKRDIKNIRQVDFPIVYDRIIYKEGLRLDVLVEDSVICKIKTVDEVNPIWEVQILSHLKLTNKRLGIPNQL